MRAVTRHLAHHVQRWVTPCALPVEAHRLGAANRTLPVYPVGRACYGLSTMLVIGRSSPRAVSWCHSPFSSSYWMTSVRPGTFCSAAARLAAAVAWAWVAKVSENTAPTL